MMGKVAADGRIFAICRLSRSWLRLLSLGGVLTRALSNSHTSRFFWLVPGGSWGTELLMRTQMQGGWAKWVVHTSLCQEERRDMVTYLFS